MNYDEKKLNRRFINKTSQKLGISTKKIIDLLFYLFTEGSIENNLLVRKIGVSKNVSNQVKQSLSPWLTPSSDHTALTEVGLNEAKLLFGEQHQVEEKIWKFFDEQALTKSVVELLNKSFEFRPPPDRQIDQFTASVETTARRAAVLNFFEDIKGKSVLCLGDDDLTSVAIALNNKPINVQVLDIDQRLLKAIDVISKKENLNILTGEYDSKNKLPEKFQNKFDIVFTDPPYTVNGINLFLSRAIQALDPNNKAARIYLCYGNSDRAKERFLPIYKIIADSGLMIRWIFDKFNRYQGAESVGSASSLFVCEVTPKTRPLVRQTYNRKIYTA